MREQIPSNYDSLKQSCDSELRVTKWMQQADEVQQALRDTCDHFRTLVTARISIGQTMTMAREVYNIVFDANSFGVLSLGTNTDKFPQAMRTIIRTFCSAWAEVGCSAPHRF
jgi:DNA anti-recombination protein RmuC